MAVENLDYKRFLKLYDAEATFFFLDPPYFDCASITYDGWGREELTEFRDRVLALKGKWIVTLNDTPFTRELFVGCRIESTVCRNGGANNRTAGDSQLCEIIVQPA